MYPAYGTENVRETALRMAREDLSAGAVDAEVVIKRAEKYREYLEQEPPRVRVPYTYNAGIAPVRNGLRLPDNAGDMGSE